ncbi:unnamed protein product [Boreogadus saida]
MRTLHPNLLLQVNDIPVEPPVTNAHSKSQRGDGKSTKPTSSLYESSDPFPARLPFSKKKRVECKAWITNFTMKNTTCPGVTVQPGLLQLLGQQGADQCNERSIPWLVSGRARGKVCLRRNDKHEVKLSTCDSVVPPSGRRQEEGQVHDGEAAQRCCMYVA